MLLNTICRYKPRSGKSYWRYGDPETQWILHCCQGGSEWGVYLIL